MRGTQKHNIKACRRNSQPRSVLMEEAKFKAFLNKYRAAKLKGL